MNIIKSLFSNLKIEELKEEYKYISTIDINIIKLYNILININKDNINLYDTEVYLLMTEYLPIDKCPIMRELIRNIYNYYDSYLEENKLDLKNIKIMNLKIINTLLANNDFKKAFEIAKANDNTDKYILNLIKECLQNNNDETIIIEKDNKKPRTRKKKIIEINTDNRLK